MRRTSTQGVAGLVRETADGLGDLVGQHFKLARLEFAADLQALSRRGYVIATCAAFAVIGYTLALAGLAAFIAGLTEVGTPLLAIGSLHLVGGATGMATVIVRLRRMHLMDATADEMGRSLARLGSAVALSPAKSAGLERIDAR